MARNVISADELKSGDIFEEGEALRMRISKVYRIRREQAWCGRLRPNTKLRLSWRFCFGPSGREHTRGAGVPARGGARARGERARRCEVFASLKSGKREVRFDRRVVHASSRKRGGGLSVAWETPGHEFRVLEAPPGALGAEEDAAAAGAKFELAVDGSPWGDLVDVDALGAEEAAAVEASVEAAVARAAAEARARRATAEAAAEATPRVNVVAANSLARLYQVQLEPGVFGTGILLRNESCASRRIEVAAILRHANLPGVVPGDVLVAINGKPLPRGASATELQELVRSNPRYALTAVDALLWRKRPVGDDASGGAELTINCGNGALGIEWARLASQRSAPAEHVDGLFAAVTIRGQASALAVKPGDVLVGINHDPMPNGLASATLLQRFSSAAARGPPTLNLWRCYDATVLDSILDQCDAAKRHALAVNPSVSAHIPKVKRDPAPASDCTC